MAVLGDTKLEFVEVAPWFIPVEVLPHRRMEFSLFSFNWRL